MLGPSSRRSLLATSACLALLGASCDDGGSTGESSDEGQPRACENESRGMVFSAGMEVEGDEALAKIQLVDASPAPPVRDLNDWSLRLMDTNGEAVEADMVVTPWMPDHGHGSPNPDTALIRSAQPGGWTLQNLDLFMAGYWEVHFDIEFKSGVTERVTYGFCVD